MKGYLMFKYVCLALLLFITIYVSFYYSSNSGLVTKAIAEQTKLKYILQWTLPNTIPFNEMKSGGAAFLERKCDFNSCFVTSSRTLLKSVADYDVIVFHGPELTRMRETPQLPLLRDPKQKYIYVSIESSHYYPLCSSKFKSFFNWTWTYKLNSDVPYMYIAVRDSLGNVVGPSADVKWLAQAEMDPVSEELKVKLQSKSKAAVWMASNCKALSKREVFVKNLQKELGKYDLEVDVYGKCGPLNCTSGDSKCSQMIEEDYYFYLSLENSFSADYVTEKLLLAVQNSAVPVVLGGADYSRFMPPGTYLDALELGPKGLAARMKELISNPEQYQNMFRWRNHYSYHDPREAPDTDPLCKLCEIINDDQLMSDASVYENFGEWWNEQRGC